jgi:hypothetical protein
MKHIAASMSCIWSSDSLQSSFVSADRNNDMIDGKNDASTNNKVDQSNGHGYERGYGYDSQLNKARRKGWCHRIVSHSTLRGRWRSGQYKRKKFHLRDLFSSIGQGSASSKLMCNGSYLLGLSSLQSEANGQLVVLWDFMNDSLIKQITLHRQQQMMVVRKVKRVKSVHYIQYQVDQIVQVVYRCHMIDC